jgi:Uncharacterised protein family (UPF0175)
MLVATLADGFVKRYPEGMKVMVELPDDVTQHSDPGREILEAFAIEGYRSRTLTQFQVGQLLGFSRIQTEDFLAMHVDLYDYTREEVDHPPFATGWASHQFGFKSVH